MNIDTRMKLYEAAEAKRRCLPLLPICVRLDGRSFHSFTRGMERPFDAKLMGLMFETMKYLVEETGACIGYTQSDEISLVYYTDSIRSQVFFDGRIQKMTSVLAAMCSVKFNREMPNYLSSDKCKQLPHFDCRVWVVPNKMEATNVILWRENDATKNSIAMAAQSVYSSNQLHKKNGADMQDMLMEKGINWNDYPAAFKRGSYVQRRVRLRKFTTEELDKLPPLHEARNNPNLAVERTDLVELDMPPLAKVINRVDVIFDGTEPETAEE